MADLKGIGLQLIISFITIATNSIAQNPLVVKQFTADPSARVFGERVYIYPSHDIQPVEGKSRPGWFCMEDYHVYSSDNLTNWVDHGVIVTQNRVPWVKPDSYSMWAPDCIERNGKYYFYFPSIPKDSSIAKGFTIGVAISDKPEGPFIPQGLPIKGVRGIDPNIFIDKDGQGYLYWSQGNIYGAKLKDNMIELASEPVTLQELPSKGLKEGPYMFERNGIYYLSYPHVEKKTEQLEYAISNNPLGPFKIVGAIMDEWSSGCWTNHHSIINFKGQWYLFYHHNDLSPQFDKNRSVRADSIYFNADGTMQKVVPTLRGIGLALATSRIELDRFSSISKSNLSILFLDTLNKSDGWKTVFDEPGAWAQFNSVDFSMQKLSKVMLMAKSSKGGSLKIMVGEVVVAYVTIPKSDSFKLVKASVVKTVSGIKNLHVQMQSGERIEVDWLSFE